MAMITFFFERHRKLDSTLRAGR